jgi:mono/diheme cytochrome c family protein
MFGRPDFHPHNARNTERADRVEINAHFGESGQRRSQVNDRCVACHGVRSQPVPVALVGECSIPVV